MSHFDFITFSSESFFTPASDDLPKFREKLQWCLFESKAPILVLEGHLDRTSQTIFPDETFLFDAMLERVRLIQACLVDLKMTDKMTVFLIGDHCMDLNFEFAMACEYRVAFRPNLLMGFAGLKYGLLPISFIFENELLRSLKARKTWSTNGAVLLQEFKQASLIDFFCEAESPDDFLASWIDQMLHKKQAKEGLRKKSSRLSASNAYPENRNNFKLDRVLDLSGVHLNQFLNWDAYWAKCKKGFVSAKEREDAEHILAYQFVKHVLSRPVTAKAFQHSLLKKIWPSSLKHSPRIKVLSICLETWLPPTQSLLQALRLGNHIFFYSSDAQSLRQQLGILVQRLFLIGQSSEIEKLWQENCHWFVGSEHLHTESKCIDIEWRSNGEVVYRIGEDCLELLRLQFGETPSDAGWCELPLSPSVLNPDLMHTAGTLSAGIIDTSGRRDLIQKAPVGFLVLNVYLEAIFLTCKALSVSWADLLECMEREGWSMIGREAFWERYVRLRYRFFSSVYEPENADLGQTGQTFKMSLWREVKENLQKQNFKSPSRDFSAYLSLSFAYLGAALSMTLVKQGYVRDSQEADLILCQTTGFPEKHGTPSYFVQRQGMKSVLRHMKEAFSQLELL